MLGTEYVSARNDSRTFSILHFTFVKSVRIFDNIGKVNRQTDNLYLSTMIIKAMQLTGSCINTKPKNKICA